MESKKAEELGDNGKSDDQPGPALMGSPFFEL